MPFQPFSRSDQSAQLNTTPSLIRKHPFPLQGILCEDDHTW